jgi:hypothetical protein
VRYDRECKNVRKAQKKRLRLAVRKWLRGDINRAEPVFRNSQGWTTW